MAFTWSFTTGDVVIPGGGITWEFTTGEDVAPGGGIIWEFFTTGRPEEAVGRACHRGPMIDVEVRMAQPFERLAYLEVLRKRLLDRVVGVRVPSVQTRETILRVLNSNVGPTFIDLNDQHEELKALICEKLNSVVIDRALQDWDFMFENGIQSLHNFEVSEQSIQIMLDALSSSNPVLRVAARCALVLCATLVEMN